jgi:hypothetical protein
LYIEGKNKIFTAVVRIGRPRKTKGDWACPFYISHIGLHEPIFVYGIDSCQAMIIALEGIRVTLEKVGAACSWIFGEKGETGFPRFVPTGFGIVFSQKIERLIDDEVAKFAEDAELSHRINKRNSINEET